MKVDIQIIEEGLDSVKSAKLKLEILKLLRERDAADKAQEELLDLYHEHILQEGHDLRRHQGYRDFMKSEMASRRHHERFKKSLVAKLQKYSD